MSEVLTHTKRRDFQNCNRYFLHRHIRHLSPRRQKRGRRKGTLFGEGLKHAQLSFTEGKPDTETLDSFFWQWLEQEYERLTETGLFNADEFAELEIERVKMGCMLTAYIERYGIDQRREVEFYLPLRNPRTGRSSRAFRIGGKIDGTMVTGPKEVAVIEDKLVGQIQRVMIERLPLDFQASEYVDAFASRGWKAVVWYRHTRWPSIEPKGPKEYKTKDDYPGETLDEYGERLAQDILDRQEFYFDQQILDFPQAHMDDYRRARWGIAQRILEARRQVGKERELESFPMNSSRCWEWGGCEFIPLCTKLEGAEALYVEVEDNPELQGEGTVTSEYGPQ